MLYNCTNELDGYQALALPRLRRLWLRRVIAWWCPDGSLTDRHRLLLEVLFVERLTEVHRVYVKGPVVASSLDVVTQVVLESVSSSSA